MGSVNESLQGLSGGAVVTFKGRHYDDLDVTAVAISPVRGFESDSETGMSSTEAVTLTVAPADIVDPARWDSVEIDGETWSLGQPPQSQTASAVTFLCTRRGQTEISRPGYRRT
jgi:hypothetical protein